ncbi:tyrosine-type recombinase/integrase [Amycolatopsis sp. NPDC006131]|uniref:tyrosine-type recombinase/integrase n=1 Tax=Amycolatopsis sp. NPDC006131 TaxID=3156731 RepID=UPI0033BA1B2A
MASTERLPSGRWRGLYVDADGRKRRVPGTFDRKSDARDAAIEAQAKAKRKAAATTGELSARTNWATWWETFAADRPQDSDTAIEQQRIADKFVLDRWGDVPLNGIKRVDVQAWVDELFRQGHSANYVRGIFGVLQVSVNAAYKRDILDASPVAGVKLPPRRKRAKKYLEPDEPAKLAPKLNAAHADATAFILETGIRPGELAGMHADQLDLEGGWLTVVNVYVRRRRAIRPRPKDGDERRVPLTAKAIEIAKRRIAGRDLHAGCGIPHTDNAECGSELVFRNVRGGVINPDVLSRRLREAALDLGLTPKSGYAARRGFATRAIEGGADVFAVQRVMGHADLDELAGYVQETREARTKMLAALGERAPLSAVEPVGRRGTDRGTNLDNQGSSDAPSEEVTDTA